MKGYRGEEMKKWLIFVALLIVPHTVWLSEGAQGGVQGGKRRRLQAILEREEEQGQFDDKVRSIFVTSPTSPPPVQQRSLKKVPSSELLVKLKRPEDQQRLKKQWSWSQIDHGDFEKFFPKETYEYIGWDFGDDDIKIYFYQDRWTGLQSVVLVKDEQVVKVSTDV